MKIRLLALGLAVIAPLAWGDVIHLTADTPWLVPTNAPEPLQRAWADVQRDWYKVFGHRPVVLHEMPALWTNAVVAFGLPPGSGATESFALRAQGRVLSVTGADTRGAIYAAYALAEDILGVDPWYYWTDHEPAPRPEIELPADYRRESGPPTFRYRGWFINDEDLLAGFAPDPLRENVFSLEMLDRICETLLRLRGNMIVPATFNFPDERNWEVAARRGLALNMHHILVVGLNTYRWPASVPFSYNRHPDIMERYWRDCIDAFRGFEVVWTVGYRGKHDRAFWDDEPELRTPAERGDVMTRAIARQVELVRAADPGAMIIANLWMEGADMMRAGQLKLPPGVVQVWPDDGSGLVRDNGAVQAGQGVYYHTAMFSGSHNQLTEMVNPGRIYSELGRFARAGATNFFLVNVSDVRPVPLSTECAMRFTWEAGRYVSRSDQENMDDFLRAWSRREFGEAVAAEVAAVYARYFDIPYQRRDTRQGDNRLHTMLRQLDRDLAPLLAAGGPLTTGLIQRAAGLRQFALTHLEPVTNLAATAAALAGRVPAERRDFYQAHVLTPIRIHQHSLEMLEHYGYAVAALAKNDRTQAVAQAGRALLAAEELAEALHRAEYGKWAAWYAGEGIVGLEGTRDRLRLLLARLRGEPLPPIRAGIGYGELYQYQQRFATNFPRLYPHVPPTVKPQP